MACDDAAGQPIPHAHVRGMCAPRKKADVPLSIVSEYAAAMSSSDASQADLPLPPVDADERAVAVDDPPPTSPTKLSALVEAHVASGFDVSTDPRAEVTDGAPDVSVFPSAGSGRARPELAFELVSTESLGRAGRKAARWVARGARRVLAIDVERARALEWSPALATWSMLDTSAPLVDPTLGEPLPLDAVMRAARADDVIARARHSRRGPQPGGLAEGKHHGRGEALVAILLARGLAVSPDDRARVLAERDAGRLARWIARAADCATARALFDEP
jgi:hypothetical protein